MKNMMVRLLLLFTGYYSIELYQRFALEKIKNDHKARFNDHKARFEALEARFDALEADASLAYASKTVDSMLEDLNNNDYFSFERKRLFRPEHASLSLVNSMLTTVDLKDNNLFEKMRETMPNASSLICPIFNSKYDSPLMKSLNKRTVKEVLPKRTLRLANKYGC